MSLHCELLLKAVLSERRALAGFGCHGECRAPAYNWSVGEGVLGEEPALGFHEAEPPKAVRDEAA